MTSGGRFGMRSGRVAVGLLLGVGLLVAGCRPRPAETELDVVRLVVQKRFTNIPLLIADAGGFFEREGIRIDRVPLSQGSEALPLLIRGQVDAAAMTSTVNLLSAIDRGATLRIVANKGYHASDQCSGSGLVARPGWAPPDGPEPLREYLRGSRFATTNSMGTNFVLSALLEQIGLSEGDVEQLSLPQAAKADALRRGTIDLAYAGEPDVSHLIGQGFALWLAANEILPDRDIAYVVFAPTLLGERRDLGIRFLRAYLAAVADYGEGKSDERVALVARETGLDPELVRRACWPAVRASGEVDLDTIREVGDWAVERGLLDRAPSPARVVDRSILEEARASRSRMP